MINFKQILLAASLSVLSGIASATVITGDILFTGGLISTNTGDVQTATVFDFTPPTTATVANGSFSSLQGQTTIYNQLDLGALTVISLWTGTGTDSVAYSFDLETVISDTTAGLSRVISGIGTVHVGANSETYGWSLTTQNPGAGTGTATLFSFSASQARVPAPSLALLLGTGLIGFGISRKLRKKA